MSATTKLAPAVVLLALVLSACGAAAKPEAGSLKATSVVHQGIDDPRKTHIQCLRDEHIAVTPGAAQNLQITGQVTGAEVIGAALVYPNQASNALLKQVETCVAKGVTG
jgi:hypothetical protein